LKDATQLTLGENATLVVDEFFYDPSMSRGALSLSVIRGAFLYVGGRIEGVNGAKVQIRTPVGAIGLRGTTVWGGPIDKGYGVIVLNGEVTVTGRKGTVTRCSSKTENLGGCRVARGPVGLERALHLASICGLRTDLRKPISMSGEVVGWNLDAMSRGS
jgi:hypothetical protein